MLPGSRALLVAAVAGALLTGLGAGRPARALVPGEPRNAYALRSWPSLAHASTVRALLASRNRGQLWVGTSDGLVRVDGQRVTSFDARRWPGIVEGNIETLLETADGTLWVGSGDWGLSRLRGEQVTTWQKRQGLPSNRVRVLERAADGTVWVGTDAGTARFAPGAEQPSIARDGLPPGRTMALAFDRDGVLWAGTIGGLARWDGPANFWQAEATPWPGSARISAMLASADGVLWVGTDSAGLWERRRQGAGASWRQHWAAEGLGSGRVVTIFQDRNLRLWVATKDGNLAFRQGERWSALLLPPRVCDREVEALADDAEGGLWIGTDACGLHRVEDRPIRVLEESEGLPRNQILGLQGARDGAQVLASTRGGGMVVVDTQSHQVRLLPCAADLPCARCWDLTPSAGQSFRGVCTKVGLQWQAGKSRQVEPWVLPAKVGPVELVMEASDGAVWLASGRRVFRWQGAEVTAVPGHEPLRGKRVLYEGRGGTVWIAADDGVVAWRAGRVDLHRLPAGQDASEASNLYEDHEGTLWIGTKGGGVRRLRQGAFATVTALVGLPTNWIAQILEDDRGRLWMSGSKGIFSIDRRELHEVADGRRSYMHANIYDGADGVLMSSDSFGHPAGWRGKDGRLWFATHGGVAIVDPAGGGTRPLPQAVIEEARIGNYRVARALGARLATISGPTQPVVLGPGTRDLEARFAVMSFAVPETISFRHRLQGKDPEWVVSGTNRIAHYADLGPGHYKLEVQARHRGGDWGPSDTALHFLVQPPFHRSPWFAAMMAVSALLLLALVHRVRLLRARAGLHAVMAERGRIARDLHDTLAQAFVATSVQLECLDHALEGQDRPTARKHLDTAMRVVRDSLEEARRSVWVLRPQALEHGLPAALETLVRRASTDTSTSASLGAVVALEVAGTPRPLSPLTEANLLRIAQEAVANAYRHARASRISLRLGFDADSVSLSVTDDGTGIVEPAASGGIQQGIAGMKERARDMGATISIERAPAGGTSIRVEVPVRESGWFSWARGR